MLFFPLFFENIKVINIINFKYMKNPNSMLPNQMFNCLLSISQKQKHGFCMCLCFISSNIYIRSTFNSAGILN